MKDLLKLKSNNVNIDNINIDNNIECICQGIISKTKEINNCILYDSDNRLSKDTLNFEILLESTKDFTGCEMWFNEICISLSELQIEFIPRFINKLKELFGVKFPNKKICFIVSFNDVIESIVLRYHTYRKSEGLWLTGDLNEYDSPILYEIQV